MILASRVIKHKGEFPSGKTGMDIRDIISEKASDGTWLLHARVFYDGAFAGEFLASGATEVEAEKRLLKMLADLEKKVKAMSETATVPDQKTENVVETASPIFVVVYNDEVHSFDQVILWLQQSCGHSVQKASSLAHEIHLTGRAQVYSGEKEKCNAVCQFLRHRGLQCEIDSIE